MPRKISQQTKVGLALSAGTAIVSSVVGGTLLGYWLDEQFGTQPWLLVAGVVLGTIGAFTWLYRLMSRLD
jgi:F0F1-type ATP synthase assembly protein I